MSRSSSSSHAGVRGGPGNNNMTTTATTPTLTERYRRNGKLQSCEPCRKSKLRCDHVVPACGRCVRRGKVNQCFYHPNPLTQTLNKSRRRGTPPPRSIPTPGTSSPEASQIQGIYESIEAYEDSPASPTSAGNFNTFSRGPQHPLGGPSQAGAGPGGSSTTTTTNTTTTATNGYYYNHNNTIHIQCQPFHRAASAPPLDWQRASGLRRDTGFQGPTSHLSILSESLGILEPAPGDDLEAVDRNLQSQESTIVVSSERVSQGCKVLSFFRDKRLITQLVGRLYEDSEGSAGLIIEPIMKEWLLQLWVHHGPVLGAQEPAKIRRLSELVFRNTLTSLEFNGETTAKEWARLGSGPNLRWEVLGSIALSVGLCVLETPAEDHLFTDNKVSRACLLGQIKDITEKCLAFCRACEVLDDMFLWLLMDYACFTECTKGERAYATYRATGETASAVVAMGLHQGIKANGKVPFFLAELRKRALLIAYYQEASIATVLGRPFRLSSRYCILDTPLDLTDRQVVATGPELEAALAGLDEDGYNKSGIIQHAGRLRSYLNICRRREDVVDLALGQYTAQEILTKAHSIQELNDHVLDDLPPFIRKAYGAEPHDSDLSHLSAFKVLNSIPLRVGCQANEILLQRILIRKTGASSEKLVRTARAVFKNVLQITQRYDIAAKFQMSYNFLLSGHGLRVAAIVATELFKQEMLPQYPENPLLPRSQTIQDLAVFAATLGNVDSSAGVHVFCQHGKRVITSILDRILSPPSLRQDGGGGPGRVVQTSRAETQVQAPGGGLVSVPVMEAESRQPSTSVGTPLGGMSVPLPEYGMVDLGIGVEAPTMLGQDSDFMSWLEGMNWETTHNWNM